MNVKSKMSYVSQMELRSNRFPATVIQDILQHHSISDELVAAFSLHEYKTHYRKYSERSPRCLAHMTCAFALRSQFNTRIKQ
jgi:hypothetical protein